MDTSLAVLICPHQRHRQVQRVLEGLAPGILEDCRLDLSQLEWAERKEGTFVRLGRCLPQDILPRLVSGRLGGTALLCWIGGGGWSYQLYYKGSQEDTFRTVPGPLADPVTPEQRAARLALRFPAGREDIQDYLVPWTPEEQAGGGEMVFHGDAHPPGDGWQLGDFLDQLVPWAWGMLTSRQLTPTATAPAPDRSSPEQNAPDRTDRASEQRPPEPEPGLEVCLPFLTAVRALRKPPAFPLFLFKKRSAEEIPCAGWTARELEEVLEGFYSGRLAWLELDFTLRGPGTFVRRLRKTVYQSFRVTLELIREGKRCMCLFLDDEDSHLYRLIADPRPYMMDESDQLEQTTFLGQTVDQYVVFQEPRPQAVRREVAFLLARLDHRDDALSAIIRNGVWSCQGKITNTALDKQQHQEIRELWRLK